MGFNIGSKDLITYVPIATTIGLTIYVVWRVMRPTNGLINPDIQKTKEKVVDSYDVEDIGDKLSLCRCWRSKTFPLCDGAHKHYNKVMGDNVGPVRIMRKSQSKNR